MPRNPSVRLLPRIRLWRLARLHLLLLLALRHAPRLLLAAPWPVTPSIPTAHRLPNILRQGPRRSRGILSPRTPQGRDSLPQMRRIEITRFRSPPGICLRGEDFYPLLPQEVGRLLLHRGRFVARVPQPLVPGRRDHHLAVVRGARGLDHAPHAAQLGRALVAEFPVGVAFEVDAFVRRVSLGDLEGAEERLAYRLAPAAAMAVAASSTCTML